MKSNDSSRLLRLALRTNAAFSFVSGLAITLLAGAISPLYGMPGTDDMLSLGIGLIVFAVMVVLISSRSRLRASESRAVVVADLLWVAGSAVLLLMPPPAFTTAGLSLLAGVGVIVAGFAALQLIGLRKLVVANA